MGPTLQSLFGPTYRLSPGEATLETLGWLRRLAMRLGPSTERLPLQSPAAGFHPLRRSSKRLQSAVEWTSWPSLAPSSPPPSPSSFEGSVGQPTPRQQPLGVGRSAPCQPLPGAGQLA